MHSPKSSAKPRELEEHQTKTFFSFRLLELLGNWIFCKGTGFFSPFTVSFFFFLEVCSNGMSELFPGAAAV